MKVTGEKNSGAFIPDAPSGDETKNVSVGDGYIAALPKPSDDGFEKVVGSVTLTNPYNPTQTKTFSQEIVLDRNEDGSLILDGYDVDVVDIEYTDETGDNKHVEYEDVTKEVGSTGGKETIDLSDPIDYFLTLKTSDMAMNTEFEFGENDYGNVLIRRRSTSYDGDFTMNIDTGDAYNDIELAIKVYDRIRAIYGHSAYEKSKMIFIRGYACITIGTDGRFKFNAPIDSAFISALTQYSVVKLYRSFRDVVSDIGSRVSGHEFIIINEDKELFATREMSFDNIKALHQARAFTKVRFYISFSLVGNTYKYYWANFTDATMVQCAGIVGANNIVMKHSSVSGAYNKEVMIGEDKDYIIWSSSRDETHIYTSDPTYHTGFAELHKYFINSSSAKYVRVVEYYGKYEIYEYEIDGVAYYDATISPTLLPYFMDTPQYDLFKKISNAKLKYINVQGVAMAFDYQDATRGSTKLIITSSLGNEYADRSINLIKQLRALFGVEDGYKILNKEIIFKDELSTRLLLETTFKAQVYDGYDNRSKVLDYLGTRYLIKAAYGIALDNKNNNKINVDSIGMISDNGHSTIATMLSPQNSAVKYENFILSYLSDETSPYTYEETIALFPLYGIPQTMFECVSKLFIANGVFTADKILTISDITNVELLGRTIPIKNNILKQIIMNIYDYYMSIRNLLSQQTFTVYNCKMCGDTIELDETGEDIYTSFPKNSLDMFSKKIFDNARINNDGFTTAFTSYFGGANINDFFACNGSTERAHPVASSSNCDGSSTTLIYLDTGTASLAVRSKYSPLNSNIELYYKYNFYKIGDIQGFDALIPSTYESNYGEVKVVLSNFTKDETGFEFNVSFEDLEENTIARPAWAKYIRVGGNNVITWETEVLE